VLPCQGNRRKKRTKQAVREHIASTPKKRRRVSERGNLKEQGDRLSRPHCREEKDPCWGERGKVGKVGPEETEKGVKNV